MREISQLHTGVAAQAEAQIDGDGVLLPDARHALRQRMVALEPLFDRDPILGEHLNRYLGLSGVGGRTYAKESLISNQEFFASLEGALVGMIPRSEGAIPSPETIAAVSSLVERLNRVELCLTLARNGELSSELFKKTEGYLRELGAEVRSICDSMLEETLPEVGRSHFAQALADLRDLPHRMRLLVTLRFPCAEIGMIRSGDIISVEHHGRYLVLGDPHDRACHVLRSNCIDAAYESYRVDLESFLPSRIVVQRGIETLGWREEPFSARQPFRTGVQVMRPPSGTSEGAHGMGEIVGSSFDGMDSLQRVLWRHPDFSATVTWEREEDLRVFDLGDRPCSSDSFVAAALTDKPNSPLYAFVRNESLQSKDRDSRELTSLCSAILSAEYPLAVHVMGAARSRKPVVEHLSSRVASCSDGGLPEEDASLLRRHGCTPVLIVVDSENNQHLTRDLKDLHEKGWKIILCSDRSMMLNDLYVEHAIADRASWCPEGLAPVVDLSGADVGPLSAAIEVLGSEAKAVLEISIQQRGSYTGPQRAALDFLGHALDALAEEDSTKTIARRPRELYLLRQAVDAIRRGDTEDTLESGNAALRQLIEDRAGVSHGATQTQASWTFRELLELSAALAKSRLPPDHPAVLLRGITCLDLSPTALAHLLHQGAQIFRHVDDAGSTRAMIISLSPAVTDETRPGLSASLGHEHGVGYIYWVWVDPDGTDEIRGAYAKLLNRIILEQLADGATFVFGRVLERNAPSIIAVRSIGGFEIVPIRAVIGGEPAVAVGIDLSREDVGQTQRSLAIAPRTVLGEALNVFTTGHPDLSQQGGESLHRERILQTHEFLLHASAFRGACENVLTFATDDLWWSSGNLIIRQAEEALIRFGAWEWLTPAQETDLARALELCCDDEQREGAKQQLQYLLHDVMPESSKTLRFYHRNICEKALESLGIELDHMPIRKPPLGLRQREPTLELPPRFDLAATQASYDRLPERAKSILHNWWSRVSHRFCWARDTHPNVYDCHRQLREWIENDIDRSGSFCGGPGVPEGEVSEMTRAHFEQLSRLVEWANHVARAGHFDQHVASFLRPILEVFVGR